MFPSLAPLQDLIHQQVSITSFSWASIQRQDFHNRASYIFEILALVRWDGQPISNKKLRLKTCSSLSRIRSISFTYKAWGLGFCGAVDYGLKECNVLSGRGEYWPRAAKYCAHRIRAATERRGAQPPLSTLTYTYSQFRRSCLAKSVESSSFAQSQ